MKKILNYKINYLMLILSILILCIILWQILKYNLIKTNNERFKNHEKLITPINKKGFFLTIAT